jgi:hypothetical protein
MRLDLGVDGPRRSEANLIRPSRGALKRAPHRNFLGCPMGRPVENTPASVEKGSPTRGRQRRR